MTPAGEAPGRPPAPAHDRRLALALLALALGGFTIGTGEFVAMGLLPEVAGGIGVSIPDAGQTISAYAIGVVIGAPLLAGLGARLPRRRLLIGLAVAFAVGNVLTALAPSFETLLVARLLCGLPHGAYFGVACLVAADLAGPEHRARAVSRVLLGLSVANVVGVPAATWLGQGFGWRAAFAAAAALSALTALGILRCVPPRPADAEATLRRELGALRRGQVWLALGIGAIGGGGFFAVYSYISPILTDRAGLASALVPLVLGVLGLGMVLGNVVAGRLMDWRPVASLFGVFLVMGSLFGLFALTSVHPLLAVANVFFLGLGVALPTGLQVRLMDVAEDAQTLAASLNHASFNIANAIGAALGGAVLAAGLGLTAPMWVAVGLTLAGIGLLAVSAGLDRRQAREVAGAAAVRAG